MSSPFASAIVDITVDQAKLQAQLAQAQTATQKAFDNMAAMAVAGSQKGQAAALRDAMGAIAQITNLQKIAAATKPSTSNMGEGMVSGLSTAFDAIKGVVGTITGFISSAFSTAMTIGTGVVVTGIAGMTTAFLMAVDSAGHFEQAMTNAQSVLRASGADFEKLRQLALDLGRDTKYTATEAAEGLKVLALAGLSVEQIMSALPAALDLAAVSGMSVANAARTAANSMKAFGLAAEEMGHVNDVLTVAFTSANTNLSELSVALRYAAPAAKITGTSIEELTAWLARMADAGFTASTAGTAMRNAMTRLEAPTKAAAALMQELGIEYESFGKTGGKSFTEVMAQVEKAVKSEKLDLGGATKIFGARGAAQLLGALEQIDKTGKAGTASIRALHQEMNNAPKDFAHGMAEKQLNTYEGQMTILKSTIDNVLIAFGTGFIERVRPGIDFLIKSFNDIATNPSLKLWGELIGEIAENIIHLAADIVKMGKDNGLGQMFTDALGIARDFTASWDDAWALLKSGAAVVFAYIDVLIAKMLETLVEGIKEIPKKVLSLGDVTQYDEKGNIRKSGGAETVTMDKDGNIVSRGRTEKSTESGVEKTERIAKEKVANFSKEQKRIQDEKPLRDQKKKDEARELADKAKEAAKSKEIKELDDEIKNFNAVLEAWGPDPETIRKRSEAVRERELLNFPEKDRERQNEIMDLQEKKDVILEQERRGQENIKHAQQEDAAGRQIPDAAKIGMAEFERTSGQRRMMYEMADERQKKLEAVPAEEAKQAKLWKDLEPVRKSAEAQKERDKPLANLFDAGRDLAGAVDKINDADWAKKNPDYAPDDFRFREKEKFDSALRVAGGDKAQAARNLGLGGDREGAVPVEFGFSGLEALSKQIQEGLSEKDDKGLLAVQEGNRVRESIETETKMMRKSLDKFDKLFGLFGM